MSAKKNIPVFTEDKNKEIISDKNLPYNFLLEGDNLHSLYLLEKTHKGCIDIIYLDPPYNTGNKDFKYNDEFVDNKDEFKHIDVLPTPKGGGFCFIGNSLFPRRKTWSYISSTRDNDLPLKTDS